MLNPHALQIKYNYNVNNIPRQNINTIHDRAFSRLSSRILISQNIVVSMLLGAFSAYQDVNFRGQLFRYVGLLFWRYVNYNMKKIYYRHHDLVCKYSVSVLQFVLTRKCFKHDEWFSNMIFFCHPAFSEWTTGTKHRTDLVDETDWKNYQNQSHIRTKII